MKISLKKKRISWKCLVQVQVKCRRWMIEKVRENNDVKFRENNKQQNFFGELLFPLHTGDFLFLDSCSDFGIGKTWHVFHLLLKLHVKDGPNLSCSKIFA